MPASNIAECQHADPKRIPLLTPGEILPMVMHQWKMACTDFFRSNKKIEVEDHVAAVFPGLKDLCARDWVTTHGDCLVGLSFAVFIKELQREFLPEGWDDELHAKICNSCLRSLDSFPKWVNDIHHLNIVLRNSEYHFSDAKLCLQLDSLFDVDLCSHCKNWKIKELVDKIGDEGDSEEEIAEKHLACWISEVWKLAEEHAHDTKHYLGAAEDLQHALKCQALGYPSHSQNVLSVSKPWTSMNPLSGGSHKPPCLTKTECSLLYKHQGCLKCRCGYQNH